MDFELQKKILNGLELTACITGFIFCKKLKHTHWKYFPVYLALIVCIEAAGEYLGYLKKYNLKLAMYNYLAIPLQVLFFNWLFYKEFAQTRFRRLPVWSAGIYTVCWLADLYLTRHGPKWWLHSFSYTAGIVLLLVLALAFLYLLATSPGVLFLKSNMMFWVCLGVFVFYFCTLPFFGMGNYLYEKHRSFYLLYAHAVYFLNWIMYSLFTIAFIWGKPKLSFSQG